VNGLVSDGWWVVNDVPATDDSLRISGSSAAEEQGSGCVAAIQFFSDLDVGETCPVKGNCLLLPEGDEVVFPVPPIVLVAVPSEQEDTHDVGGNLRDLVVWSSKK
jgi:hypothetical protein